MISIYNKSIHDDPRVRTYIALAMGQTGNITFGEVLLDGLKDISLDNKIAAIKSLGSVKYLKATDSLNSIVNSNDSDEVRLAAIISLGQIKNKSSVPYLVKALDDEEANIRWDAAISLYKMDDKSGYTIIERLLSRDYYLNYKNVDFNEASNTILTVLALISPNPSEIFKDELIFLSENEKNIKIREFSMKILVEHY